MIRFIKPTVGILAILAMSSAASAAEPARTTASDALTRMTKGQLACTALRVSYRETDSLGSITDIAIRDGSVIVKTTRIGLGEQTHTGKLTIPECHALASWIVANELWNIKTKPAQGVESEYRPLLKIGATGAASFERHLPRRFDQKTLPLDTTRNRLKAIANRVSSPPKTAAR